jgi:microcystin-dependent protein
MAEPYLAEVRIFSFGFAPQGWAMCNGQLLPINQNQALFSLLGTTYGGNGTINFALPNLQGRASLHIGTNFAQGQVGGEVSHTLLTSEIPSHTHQVVASSTAPNANVATNNFFASNTGIKPYATTSSELMSPNAVSTVGGSQPHNNMSPYLALNFCIALQGIFPSRN